MKPTVPQARMVPKSLPLRRVMRMVAASSTGPTAPAGMAASVHSSRMPQNSLTKKSPMGTMPAMSAPMTMACRQSLALSAIRPTIRLSARIMNTGTALMMPICSVVMPFSLSQMGRNMTAAPGPM
ncbi:hypothetical protein D3C72_2141630 [compost metagenome]